MAAVRDGVDIILQRLDAVAFDRHGMDVRRAGKDVLGATRQQQRIAGFQLRPLPGWRKKPASVPADEVETRRLLGWKEHGPRLAKFAAAVIDAIKPQSSQHVGQRTA
ncbi:hypothetical protein MesoLj131c_18150 [Mesorhizobium sp. 131-3-5]|nr:hypothetical protein MesoLj131c_18150 [Mesorhizobium sp. 131-3-5]